MARPRSKETQAALDDIAAGLTQYAAAKKHGVHESVLSRILHPKKIDKIICTGCGRPIISKKIQKT